MRLLWLADAFAEAGLVVVEEPGWQNRGKDWTDLVGMMQHHTACCMPYPVHKLYPARPGQWRIRANFSVQPGPGNPNNTPAKIHVIAAGYCNYSSGSGSGRVLRETRQDIAPSEDAARRRLVDTATGSKHFVNNETAHRGDGSPIPAPMLETIDIAWYIIAKELGLHPNRLISHAEWTRRKIDPRWNNLRSHHTMEQMRTRLTANRAGGGTPPLAGPPQEKEQTMRRGDSGQAVADLQRAAIETHGADFGAWDPWGPGYPSGADGDYGPATESFVLDFQRTRGLEPTGIVDGLTAALILSGEPTGGPPGPAGPPGTDAPIPTALIPQYD